jgi:hypothetical protein
MAEMIEVETDGPRAGREYSRVIDRGEGAPAAAVLVVIIEGFAGGVALKVVLEGSPDGHSFAPVAEGQRLLEDHLRKGERLLQADIAAGGPRWLRLCYESTDTHRVGQVFGAIMTAQAEREGSDDI